MTPQMLSLTKEKSWTYGGKQKRKDKMDEDEEGQRRIKEMFVVVFF